MFDLEVAASLQYLSFFAVAIGTALLATEYFSPMTAAKMVAHLDRRTARSSKRLERVQTLVGSGKLFHQIGALFVLMMGITFLLNLLVPSLVTTFIGYFLHIE